MSPITLRGFRPLLLTFAALVAVPGLAACGGGDDQLSQQEIEEIVDRQGASADTNTGAESASQLAKEQLSKDADQAAADEAIKRRKELEQIQAEQKREAEKVMEGDVAESAEDLEQRRFRARVAGVCEGAAGRIGKVSKAAEKATKSDDPTKLLKVATDYNDALSDFRTALGDVAAPASQQKTYASWLGTIDDLANNIRLQIVSLVNPSESAKLQEETARLTSKFLEQTAELGVPCLTLGT